MNSRKIPKSPHSSHRRITPRCSECDALKKDWYGKLKAEGFKDIEYGLENASLLKVLADPSEEEVQATNLHQQRAWLVFEEWCDIGRSVRDCRVAELYAKQFEGTGTVRGIVHILKEEQLTPNSITYVFFTLKEIKQAIKKY